jgi:hypothetical protein
MRKRARYDGPHTSVLVFPWGSLDGRHVEVERGHQLPTEIDGESVPAAVRDELIARQDWSEVQHNTSPPEKPAADKQKGVES